MKILQNVNFTKSMEFEETIIQRFSILVTRAMIMTFKSMAVGLKLHNNNIIYIPTYIITKARAFMSLKTLKYTFIYALNNQ